MKSIIQEASSIAKAIELGWIKAGKPKDFTVKVYEEAEKNFFGFTKKNAKVGIFFTERPHGRDGRRPQKHAPQRRRFKHRRDDRRDDQRRDERPKWYKPQEERQQETPRRDEHKGREQSHRPHDRHQKHTRAHGPREQHSGKGHPAHENRGDSDNE